MCGSMIVHLALESKIFEIFVNKIYTRLPTVRHFVKCTPRPPSWHGCKLRSTSAAPPCVQLWPAGRLASYPVLSTPYHPSFLSLKLDSVLLYSSAGDISMNLWTVVIAPPLLPIYSLLIILHEFSINFVSLMD